MIVALKYEEEVWPVKSYLSGTFGYHLFVEQTYFVQQFDKFNNTLLMSLANSLI